ncbi:MAG: tRNA glutamyl-Q(34) synthetase GluQRS [Sulfuricellaceae bacterium]|nr:tRNA glutamyl-Q(34) synthetase GluQRS [Sulfuricellaceae bacterium]
MNNIQCQSVYRGRFAPSPTGPLHFGSMVAAVGSYLDAKSQGGQWLLRMEDLDPPRVVAGAADNILRTLEAFGLGWDGETMWQSRRGKAYQAALDELRRQSLVYPCNCSRREISDSSLGSPSGLVYPGLCRHGLRGGRNEHALRVLTHDEPVIFVDRLQGEISQHIEREVGDFVLRRADDLVAYQLAVVVDDGEQQITDVVRGADILDSTPRQIYLQQLLGLPLPNYLHLPVALNEAGEKLSKQTLAAPVDANRPVETLMQVLLFLGQHPPPDLAIEGVERMLTWAVTHWDVNNIQRCRMLEKQGGG